MSRRARPSKVVGIAVARATLGDIWDRLANAYGDRTAVTLEEPLAMDPTGARSLTYNDIAAYVARIAGALAEVGVEPGERVAVCMGNRIDYALTCFAAVRAGAVAIPLHHHLKPQEIASLAARARATYVVVDKELLVQVDGAMTLAASRLDGAHASASAPAVPRVKPMPVDPEEPALILFTSGTTGAPKGATITSRSLLAVARLAALVPDARSESGVCGLPLAHVMGMSTLLCTLLAGAPLHWLSKFDAAIVLDTIQKRRTTFFIGVPAMYAMLAEAADFDRCDLSSVRLWASGADAMPPHLVEKFRKRGVAFRSPRGKRLLTSAFAEVYGMVELSGPAILKLTPPGPFDDGPVSAPVRSAVTAVTRLRARLARAAPRAEGGTTAAAAMGMLIPPYRARIVDDHGKPVKPGVVGELVLKGPGVTSGYDNDPEATARTTKDGWLRTGDLARKSRVGLIAFATRKKDVVKHGGYSVFPAEVEAQLGAHPAIAEAVVFGVPHPTKGAVPAAAVVLAKGQRISEGELLQWARDNIASYKAPRSLAIVKSEDIPRNANKKVLKDELKTQLLSSKALKTLEPA